jgi:hypothetical protein
VPDGALARHLRQARAILAALPDGNGAEPGAAVFDGFDRLRWFELPSACLTPPPAEVGGLRDDGP